MLGPQVQAAETIAVMTLSTTFGTLHPPKVSKGGTALFNELGIYHLCLAFVVLDFLDLLNLLDVSAVDNAVKYCYAAIVIGFMVVYYIRWRRISASVAPFIFLLFFVATGLVFTINFFIYGERLSYISAFIAPLVFSLALFVPANSTMLDASRITRQLTLLFSLGTLFYLIEAIVKRVDSVQHIAGLNEVQVHKSIICVLALCLSILTGQKILTLFLAAVTVAALVLRPMSTLVLALICCLPIAVALRRRVLYPRPISVLVGRAIAITTLCLAVSVPLLLYFYFDDVSALVDSWESYLKSDVLGGHSNMAFRLAILKYAFTAIDNTSFWYGSALSGNHTISLALLPGWAWWWNIKGTGEATIHSDFVVVLVLMGIIGYTVFSIAFYLVLRDRFRELSRRDLRGSAVVLHSIAAIGVVALIVYCSDEPWLSYYDHANAVWMLLLISEIARKSRVIGNAERRALRTISGSARGRLRLREFSYGKR